MAPKIPPKKTFKEQAKVLFQYTAENEDELTIKEGDIINIISKQIEDKGWMKGELNGNIGVFPDNFVEILPNTSLQSNQTTNNFQKSTTNNFINNGTNDSPPKLPATKKPIPETKLSKSITSKFNEIISKSNNSINETSTPKSLFNLSTKQQTDDSINNKSTINQAPNLPVKKTKLFTTPKPSFHQRESSEENLDKQDDLNSFIDEPNNLSPIKLTHLTANRNKGPTRRPPSIIQIPKDDELSLTSSNSLNNLTELNDNKNNSNNLDDQLNKELNNKINNKTSETMLSKTTTNQPPWMLELKKTQAEKKNVEVGKMKKNFSLTDETNTSTSNLNGNSPNSSKKSINQSPNSPTKLTNTSITATPFNHRMSGDYTSRFKEFLQQQPTTQNSTNVNSLSRHSSVNNHHNFNSSRTLSTDSLDCKEQTTSLGFGNLASPFKPIKAAKPTVNKFISGSPTTTTTTTTTNNFLSNSNLNSSNNQLINNNQINKDLVSRKEFDELQKRVNDLTDIVENQKQIYKGLVTDLINDIAEEKKKVANLSIEIDRLRKIMIS